MIYYFMIFIKFKHQTKSVATQRTHFLCQYKHYLHLVKKFIVKTKLIYILNLNLTCNY